MAPASEMTYDDAYDEEKEGFGVKPIDNAPTKPYTDTAKTVSDTKPAPPVIAPKEQKVTPMAEAKTKVDNSKIRELDPKHIKIEEGFNARDFSTPSNKEHLNNLLASIKEVGVLEALTVRYDQKTGEYFLVNGESRLRATLQAIKDGAPIKMVPVNFERKGTSNEDRVATLITRNEGKSLNVLEQSVVFQRLHDMGWKDLEIARKTGKTGPFVGSVLKLAAAPQKLKDLVANETASATLVISILRDNEFDYEKAYAAISDGVATAAVNGKAKVTSKDVKKKKAPSESKTPLHFQRGNVTVFIDVLAEIAADTSLNRGTRSKAKNALENADIDAREWLAQAISDDEEED
jgi:ParB/RepB/Spo0J family partition protein